MCIYIYSYINLQSTVKDSPFHRLVGNDSNMILFIPIVSYMIQTVFNAYIKNKK
jgi:hypothetical protein